MKRCCQEELSRLADTDSLVDILMNAHDERDAAIEDAKRTKEALNRVSDLHAVVVKDGGPYCSECCKPAPCDTEKALRIR